MEVTDKELLELAAKAAGYNKYYTHYLGRDSFVTYDEIYYSEAKERQVTGKKTMDWNPLADDGDALRLAVALNLTVVFHPALNQALCRPYHTRDMGSESREDAEKHARQPPARGSPRTRRIRPRAYHCFFLDDAICSGFSAVTPESQADGRRREDATQRARQPTRRTAPRLDAPDLAARGGLQAGASHERSTRRQHETTSTPHLWLDVRDGVVAPVLPLVPDAARDLETDAVALDLGERLQQRPHADLRLCNFQRRGHHTLGGSGHFFCGKRNGF